MSSGTEQQDGLCDAPNRHCTILDMCKFQGHHTDQACYESGIMSPEYPRRNAVLAHMRSDLGFDLS
jgi:hypothetical protein